MKRIAHRGATQHFPENTLEGLLKAVELGFDGVEFDVRRCQSGELILMHDQKLERTTSGRGLVADASFEQIKSLSVNGGYAIPTLTSVLQQLLPKTWLDIEIKDADPSILGDIAKLIPRSQRGRVLISSKRREALAVPAGGLQLAFIHPLAFVASRQAKRLGLTTIVTRSWFINRFGWRRARRTGLAVYLYVANRRRQLAGLKRAGIAGVISDTEAVLK